MFTSAVALLNNNKIMWALSMVIFNLGSRHVMSDMSPTHERLLSNALFKRVAVFCMFFVATRDVIVSIIMTAAFLFVFNVLLHEDSPYCIVPWSVRTSARAAWVQRMDAANAAAKQQKEKEMEKERATEGGMQRSSRAQQPRVTERTTVARPSESESERHANEPRAANDDEEDEQSAYPVDGSGDGALQLQDDEDSPGAEHFSPPAAGAAEYGANIDHRRAPACLEEAFAPAVVCPDGVVSAGFAAPGAETYDYDAGEQERIGGGGGDGDGNGDHDEEHMFYDVATRSGAGRLYADDDNENDITRGTSLDYVPFDDGTAPAPCAYAAPA